VARIGRDPEPAHRLGHDARPAHELSHRVLAAVLALGDEISMYPRGSVGGTACGVDAADTRGEPLLSLGAHARWPRTGGVVAACRNPKRATEAPHGMVGALGLNKPILHWGSRAK